jgi:hypothetical protein
MLLCPAVDVEDHSHTAQDGAAHGLASDLRESLSHLDRLGIGHECWEDCVIAAIVCRLQPIDESPDGYVQALGKAQQFAERQLVLALLVFLDLVEGDIHHLGKLLLAQAECDAPGV